MSFKKSILYKWIISEKGMIIWTSFLGAIAGIIYAHEVSFPSAVWFQKFLNGLAVVSVLSGAIIRYIAAVNRERSGQTTKKIEEVLIKTGEKMVMNFKKITYDSEIKHYQFMLGRHQTPLPNIWHFKLRFESQSQLHIEVVDSSNIVIKDNYVIQINGFVDQNHGGFMNRFYIAEILDILSQGNPGAPLFQRNQIVACSWVGQTPKICLEVNDMHGGNFPVHDFSITGIPGQVTFHTNPPLASTVTAQPRLFDELNVP